jgi:predicted RNA-binding protein with PUA-like domain
MYEKIYFDYLIGLNNYNNFYSIIQHIMKYWLFKSEPSNYSIKDLEKDKKTFWEGIRNYQARNMIRDTMDIGDQVLFYHSNAGPNTGVVGEMKLIQPSTPDPTQYDSQSVYFDSSATPSNPRWYGVWVTYQRTFSKPVLRPELLNMPDLADSALVKKGNRLSIVPLTKKQYQSILNRAK